MKKIFSRIQMLVAIIMLMLCIMPALSHAGDNYLYTATVSTVAITDNAKLADINLATVKIKSITVAQTAATAQNLTLYKNANSTATITAVAVYAVPGTVGTYVVYPFVNISTSLTAADAINIPYFAIRSSSSTSASSCIVNVEYWK
jgi:uncharacterized membrane protein